MDSDLILSIILLLLLIWLLLCCRVERFYDQDFFFFFQFCNIKVWRVFLIKKRTYDRIHALKKKKKKKRDRGWEVGACEIFNLRWTQNEIKLKLQPKFWIVLCIILVCKIMAILFFCCNLCVCVLVIMCTITQCTPGVLVLSAAHFISRELRSYVKQAHCWAIWRKLEAEGNKLPPGMERSWKFVRLEVFSFFCRGEL